RGINTISKFKLRVQSDLGIPRPKVLIHKQLQYEPRHLYPVNRYRIYVHKALSGLAVSMGRDLHCVESAENRKQRIRRMGAFLDFVKVNLRRTVDNPRFTM